MSSANETVVVSSSSETQSVTRCPYCQAQVGALDKICYNCGRDLPTLLTLSTPQRILSGSLPTETTARPAVPTPLEQHASPVAYLLEHLPVPARTTRELFVDVGNRLFHEGNYAKAADAFQEAREADGDQPATCLVLFYYALASEKAEQFERSFRAYLEAVLLDPERLDDVLTYLHARLTTDIALKHGSWLTQEWQPKSTDLPLNAGSRARVALFAGHVKLFLADYTGAQTDFEQAVKLAPDMALAMAGEILTDERLPGTLSSSQDDGNTHYLRAQLFITLHSYESASREVNLALDAAKASSDDALLQKAQSLKDQLLQLASYYYEQGTTSYGSGEYAQAIEQLRLSAQLRPAFSPVYWYWADALFMQSTQAQELNDRRPLINDGMRTWETGFSYGAPDAAFAWAYTSKALLCEAMASLPENSTVAYWWEAAAHIESSLLLGKDDAYNWAYLGRYHRFLNNEQNALGATARALELADAATRIDILTDKFAVLANAGQLEEAEQLVNELVEKFPNPWMKTAKAVVLMNQQRLDECITLLDEALQENEAFVWGRYLRAYTYRRRGEQGDIERSNQEYDWLLSYTQEQEPSDRDYFAWAQYQRGDPRKAIAYHESLLDNPAQVSYFNLGLCYLKLDEVKNARLYLLKGVRNAINNRQLVDYTRDLDDLAASLGTLDIQEPGTLAQASTLITQVRGAIERQRVVVQQPRSTESELLRVLKNYTYHSEIGRWAWIEARAGLARILPRAAALARSRRSLPPAAARRRPFSTGAHRPGEGCRRAVCLRR